MRAEPSSTAGVVLLALLCLSVQQAPGQETAAGELSNAELRALLERHGAVIGAVNVIVDNVFDPSDPAEDRRLYRWANRVHVRTRESVIESVLLFKAGEVFEGRLLDESARLLRSRGYVADAVVSPADYDAATNTVTVRVRVRDAWSLAPDLRFSRSGGENEIGVGITEANLFGAGKELTLSFKSDVDRDQRAFGYSDPNVGGRRARLSFAFADTSDGDRVQLAAGRPFYALDARWAAGGELLDDQRVDKMYDRGETVDEFRHDTRALSVQGGWSRGLVHRRARRWLFGLTSEEDEFQPSNDVPQPLLLPGNRKVVYPWVGFQLVAEDYREMTDLNDMGRTEDVSLGLNLVMRLGRSERGFGADRDATLFSASAQKGWEPGGPGRLLLFGMNGSARWEHDGVHNAVLSGGARYYHRNLGRHLFSASLEAAASDGLDAENQVLLGGDNGLRGYPLRYQSGESRAVLTLEQRFYTDLYPFRLFRVGYAVFMDAGRVWGRDPRGLPGLGMLYDLGAGLRLTSPRSSGRSIVHIDLAFPLNGDSSIDSLQLLLETKSSF